jgi:hypothetical protein
VAVAGVPLQAAHPDHQILIQEMVAVALQTVTQGLLYFMPVVAAVEADRAVQLQATAAKGAVAKVITLTILLEEQILQWLHLEKGLQIQAAEAVLIHKVGQV